jgi:uncharacterized protein YigA (DUF484 family)
MIDGAQLALYLRDNPDFFSAHSELLRDLKLTHPQPGGPVISLVERQLHGLRERIAQLEHQLADLMTYGTENDRISDKVHRLALALIGAGHYEPAREILFSSLQEDFLVPHVALRLWRATASGDAVTDMFAPPSDPVFAPVSPGLRQQVGELHQPCCAAPDNAEVLGWFGEGAHVRSMVLVPLQQQRETTGLLVLGSPEAERFYPGMGMLYIGRIGELASAAFRSAVA